MEYIETGSLQDLLKIDLVKEDVCAFYIEQVLRGLQYLHSQGVMHRDIKGANILLTKDGRIKITDFGVSTMEGHKDGKNPVGTPYWSYFLLFFFEV